MIENADISVHRYPLNVVVGDYLRALIGMVMTFGPLIYFNIGTVMVYILSGLGALFLLFGFRTVLRHLTRLEVSDQGIRITGYVGRAVRWQDLDDMSLRYYTTRRDKSGGWMLLNIKGKGSVVTLDSTLDGFDDILRHSVDVARANHVDLEVGTLTNLASLGINVAPDTQAP